MLCGTLGLALSLAQIVPEQILDIPRLAEHPRHQGLDQNRKPGRETIGQWYRPYFGIGQPESREFQSAPVPVP